MVLFGVVGKKPGKWAADVDQQVEGYCGFAQEFIGKAFMDDRAIDSTVGTLIHAAVSQQPSRVTRTTAEATTPSDSTSPEASQSPVENGKVTPVSESGKSEAGAASVADQDAPEAADAKPASTTLPESTEADDSSAVTATVVVEQAPAVTDPLRSDSASAAPATASAPAAKLEVAASAASSGARKGSKSRRRGAGFRTPAAVDPDYDQLWEDVRKDVVRTHSNLSFFQRRASLEGMCRILYIYGKLNPGLAYVQGMNELLAPIFWVCHNCPVPEQAVALSKGEKWEAPDEPSTELATRTGYDITRGEALSFFLFTALMAETRDLFIKRLDNSSGENDLDSGIGYWCCVQLLGTAPQNVFGGAGPVFKCRWHQRPHRQVWHDATSYRSLSGGSPGRAGNRLPIFRIPLVSVFRLAEALRLDPMGLRCVATGTHSWWISEPLTAGSRRFWPGSSSYQTLCGYGIASLATHCGSLCCFTRRPPWCLASARSCSARPDRTSAALSQHCRIFPSTCLM